MQQKKPVFSPIAEDERNMFARRKVLKILVAGGGLMAASSILPTRWTEPIVGSIVLPVHAQTSGYHLVASASVTSGEVCWIENITATMSPPRAGVTIHVIVSGTGATAPADAVTNSAGVASFTDILASTSGVCSLIFSFADPTYGSGTATLGPYQTGVC